MSRAEEFNVGDVVIGVNLQMDTEYNGARGVITKSLRYNTSYNEKASEFSTDYRYMVKWDDGEDRYVAPRNLRKPPEEFDHATKLAYAELVQRLTRVHAFEKAAKP